MPSQLSRCLLRTEFPELLQRPRLNSAHPAHRHVKQPGGLRVCPGIAVGKPESEFYYAAIEIVQPEEQFAYLQGLGEYCIQVIAGVQALQTGAIEKLQRVRHLVREQTGCPLLAPAKRVS